MAVILDMNIPHVSNLDLNLLVALEALLAESNVTRAAARIGLSQSAMSHKLRRLREQFDDPLLVAVGGGLARTPYAEQLLGPLRHGLRELRGVWTGPKDFDPATSDREFVVVSSDYAEFAILPLVLQYTTTHAPNVRCRLLDPTPETIRGLEDGSVDIVMGPSLPPRAGLVQRRVGEEGLVCLVREDHPVIGDELDLDLYLSVKHLVTSPGKQGNGDAVGDALAAMGKARDVSMVVPHFIGGPFIVAKSDLILTTARTVATAAARILPLRVLPLPLHVPTFGVMMTWHDRFTKDHGHRWLRELAARTTARVISGEE